MVTRYLPRASDLASAFALGILAISAACTANGSPPARTIVINRAAKSNLMHPSVLFSKLRIENLPARDRVRATARALYTRKMPRLRPRERLNAVGGQREPDPGVADTRPG